MQNESHIVLRADAVESYLTVTERHILSEILQKVDLNRPANCVVIEADWPEYQPTVDLLTARIKREVEEAVGPSREDIAAELEDLVMSMKDAADRMTYIGGFGEIGNQGSRLHEAAREVSKWAAALVESAKD